MSIGPESVPSVLEDVSALVDGELDQPAAARACSAWKDDPGVRSRWHAYQLVGDVLRSDDLASDPAHDAQFLAVLRTRLSAQATVLAPIAPAPQASKPAGQLVAKRSHRLGWVAPSAVAAGFVLVAGALVVARGPITISPMPRDANVLAKTSTTGTLPAAAPAWAPNDIKVVQRSTGGNGKLIRDARLDGYLAAHQQFAGSSALGVPSGFVRNAAAEAPNR